MIRNLRNDAAASLFVGAASSALILGALVFQYAWNYPPCDLCMLQRWPHVAAIMLGLGGGLLMAGNILPTKTARRIAWLVIFAIALSGVFGVYHAGVEWKWWPGPTACTSGAFTPGPSADFAPFRLVRCDEAAWRFLGLSLAGYNALLSFAAAWVGMAFMRRKQGIWRRN